MRIDSADYILCFIGKIIIRRNLCINACLIGTADDHVDAFVFQFFVQGNQDS